MNIHENPSYKEFIWRKETIVIITFLFSIFFAKLKRWYMYLFHLFIIIFVISLKEHIGWQFDWINFGLFFFFSVFTFSKRFDYDFNSNNEKVVCPYFFFNGDDMSLHFKKCKKIEIQIAIAIDIQVENN